ncbi:amino acid-binding protein [Georgenia sp. 10Sc9-8]|uniref:Amino acid-binding protein n=1 Tax=Georgenia halotolerans TaxID=3028317 RepID=A0ABT5U481_9MICO|nr:amino acid-binding protein [Georgenia halotolerans]
MTRHDGGTSGLACDVCGRLPEPRKGRLTLANVVAMLPVELAVHALVLQSDLSYLLKVLLLTVTATVLVIWVAEPSVTRVLRRWLHAPALRTRRRYDGAEALWRIRTQVEDAPGALGAITHELAMLGANILGMHLHPGPGGVVDEFVVATPEGVTARALSDAVHDAGGEDPQVWPTTPLALVDGQTKALNLAVRVVGDPDVLPDAVAELLDAEIVDGAPGVPASHVTDGATLLKVPARWHGAHVFSRPGEPFTPAESARAHRLAELAEVVDRGRTGPSGS